MAYLLDQWYTYKYIKTVNFVFIYFDSYIGEYVLHSSIRLAALAESKPR